MQKKSIRKTTEGKKEKWNNEVGQRENRRRGKGALYNLTSIAQS